KTGYQLKALITLKVFMGKLKPFLDKVTDYDEVINCYRITGNENIILEVVLRNQSHLEKFIDKLIVYGETKTHIVLSNVIENAPIKKKPSALP
ncbi:MAG TPA: Lrp/AsnC ligand binding domain-containing protein, partial [Flavobacteriaceae bacterium]|nr:Lrp/AsnC ligand binding domain-containing protein [Flavobacteriaceae bacterium]